MTGSSIIEITVASPPITPLSNVLITVTDERKFGTVSDSKNLLYFFESSLTPNTFWVNLRETDLSEGAPVLKLSIANGETYHGNATKEFKPAQPFRFMGVKG